MSDNDDIHMGSEGQKEKKKQNRMKKRKEKEKEQEKEQERGLILQLDHLGNVYRI